MLLTLTLACGNLANHLPTNLQSNSAQPKLIWCDGLIFQNYLTNVGKLLARVNVGKLTAGDGLAYISNATPPLTLIRYFQLELTEVNPLTFCVILAN